MNNTPKDAVIARRDGDRVHLDGEFRFDTVPTMLAQSAEWFTGAGGELAIDLSGITRSDSAGVALLLEWLRRARAAGHTIRYLDPPAQMSAIIAFSALGDILPIERQS